MRVALKTYNLTRVYKTPKKPPRVAVDDLCIEVPEGAIFGFLGPNGAGKTTTIKTVLDFIRPTMGRVEIFGRDSTDPDTRRHIGYLPEQPYFQRFLKPIELVTMHAGLHGLGGREARTAANRAIERAGMADYADTPLAKLSKGLTQRIGIAQAIVGDPRLLILDEPTSGLDPIGRRYTRDLLVQLRNEGKTVFLSSHVLSEIEDICDIVAVMKQGRLVACGPPEKIKNTGGVVVIETAAADAETKSRLRFLEVDVRDNGGSMLLRVDISGIHEVMKAIDELGIPITRMETERESLEEAFLRLAA